jgi:hypothetical protein
MILFTIITGNCSAPEQNKQRFEYHARVFIPGIGIRQELLQPLALGFFSDMTNQHSARSIYLFRPCRLFGSLKAPARVWNVQRAIV